MNEGDILECRVSKKSNTYSFWRDDEEIHSGCVFPEEPFVFAILLSILGQSIEIL